MNRRDLFESMAYIDSTILERSERRKRPARRPIRWWNAVAAVVAVALLLGLIVMVLFRPRSWCAFCPMGTMTQSICKLRNRRD